MDINYEMIGMRVRDYRKRQNITQAQLGELSGVEPSNISHIERGATKVSLPTLIKIANVLKVTLNDLVYDSLEKSGQVSVKEMNALLSDCSDAEMKALVEICKSTKAILRGQSGK